MWKFAQVTMMLCAVAFASSNVADIQAGRANDPIIESGDVLVANTSPLKKGLNSVLKVLPLGGAAAGAVPR